MDKSAFYISLGLSLRLARKDKRYTLQQLADRIGVKRQSISQWENGNNGITIYNLFAVCDALDININDVLPVEKRQFVAYSGLVTGDGKVWNLVDGVPELA